MEQKSLLHYLYSKKKYILYVMFLIDKKSNETTVKWDEKFEVAKNEFDTYKMQEHKPYVLKIFEVKLTAKKLLNRHKQWDNMKFLYGVC